MPGFIDVFDFALGIHSTHKFRGCIDIYCSICIPHADEQFDKTPSIVLQEHIERFEFTFPEKGEVSVHTRDDKMEIDYADILCTFQSQILSYKFR